MSKKTLFIVIGILVFIIGGFYLINREPSASSVPDSKLAAVNSDQISISPETYDIGKVIMKDGNITREYEIKNDADNPLRIKKISTSCMCTKAKIEVGDKKSRNYGMEMQGDANPIINFDIPAKTTAKLVVTFDPAAHGIEGVGKIERSVYITFLDPIGTKEIKFFGEVALQ